MAEYAPGMRVLVRDEEWMIRKCDRNSYNTYCFTQVLQFDVKPLRSIGETFNHHRHLALWLIHGPIQDDSHFCRLLRTTS